MRYAMRIAEFRESSDPWTQLALWRHSMSVSVSENFMHNIMCLTKRSSLWRTAESYIKDVRVDLWVHRIGHWHFSDFDRKSNYLYAHRTVYMYVNMYIQPSLLSASEIRQEHPLNLSILLSGGKEINEDCLSSGERSGKSSSQICDLRSPNCNLKGLAKGEGEA